MARRKTYRLMGLAVITGGVLFASCTNDSLAPPTSDVNAMFDRFVTIGNSVTAGFQSAGINDSTQLESYAWLVAQGMGLNDTSEFLLPLLNSPGCPGPFTDIYTQTRVGGGGSSDCALRELRFDHQFNNVAVPGAQVHDILTNLTAESSPNPLTTFILGGSTQLEAALLLDPTFVSMMIGNNDVLGYALSGGTDPTAPTPTSDFDQDYQTIMNSLLAAGVQGGVLVGVFNVTNIPFLSAGIVYAGAQAASQLPPPPFLTLVNCAPPSPGAGSLIPFSYGIPKVDSAVGGANVTIDCLADPEVLNPTEAAVAVQAIAEYNTIISSTAASAGWAYLDPNTTLDSLRAAGEIPLFPTPPPTTEPFGEWFSLDGVHPNGQAHVLIAQKLIEAINAEYETLIPDVN